MTLGVKRYFEMGGNKHTPKRIIFFCHKMKLIYARELRNPSNLARLALPSCLDLYKSPHSPLGQYFTSLHSWSRTVYFELYFRKLLEFKELVVTKFYFSSICLFSRQFTSLCRSPCPLGRSQSLSDTHTQTAGGHYYIWTVHSFDKA